GDPGRGGQATEVRSRGPGRHEPGADRAVGGPGPGGSTPGGPAGSAGRRGGRPVDHGPGASWAYGSGASATQGDVAANWALSQLGKPYLWGGAGPDAYDCSGLTMQAWARAGVQLLHWT